MIGKTRKIIISVLLFTVFLVSMPGLAPAIPKIPTADKDVIVYVTNTGSKYHRGSCSSLSKSKIEITLQEAKAQGYAPCKRCNPPR